MKLSELNQSQAGELKHMDVTALLPLGAVEVHGDHLPLGTDLYLAQALTDLVEKKIGEDKALVLPVLPYGQVWSLREAPGSVHIPNDVLSGMIAGIGRSLWRAGVRRMAVINSHVGNGDAMKTAARNLHDLCSMKVYLFTYPGADEAIRKVCTSPMPHKGYFHACEIETSYMLYLCPQRVNMEKAVCQYPDFPPEFDYTPIPWTKFMDRAFLGDAKAATAGKGQVIIQAVVDRMCEILSGKEE